MMKKKVLSVFLCAGLAVSMLAGCGSGNSDTKDKKDAAAVCKRQGNPCCRYYRF